MGTTAARDPARSYFETRPRTRPPCVSHASENEEKSALACRHAGTHSDLCELGDKRRHVAALPQPLLQHALVAREAAVQLLVALHGGRVALYAHAMLAPLPSARSEAHRGSHSAGGVRHRHVVSAGSGRAHTMTVMKPW